ncbi:MAG: DUF1801 domain-containing protein [bacterium]|nr:DUF1801 domain-containing protein [bacterium]
MPILEKIRKAVHVACPGVEETLKWGNPCFEHGGILVGASAHKNHVNFSFWRGAEMVDPEGLLEVAGKTRLGSVRLEKVADLPTQRVIVGYVKGVAVAPETRLPIQSNHVVPSHFRHFALPTTSERPLVWKTWNGRAAKASIAPTCTWVMLLAPQRASAPERRTTRKSASVASPFASTRPRSGV